MGRARGVRKCLGVRYAVCGVQSYRSWKVTAHRTLHTAHRPPSPSEPSNPIMSARTKNVEVLMTEGIIVNLRRYSRPIALAAVALWTAGLPVSLHAQSALAEAQVPARYADAVEFARTLMTAVMEESGTPGMSVAVGIDGRVVWSEGFGYADVEHRVPVWEETKFRIGSVSKPVTAAAIGLLVEQGKLDLDAPVQRYVPSFPEKRWSITTRHPS